MINYTISCVSNCLRLYSQYSLEIERLCFICVTVLSQSLIISATIGQIQYNHL